MLKLEKCTKIFEKGTINEKVALNQVDLKVNKGDFITLLGSNGAGKSTLFNAIAGTFLVDEGKILLDNENITYVADYKRAKVIGRMFQDPLKGTAPHMTIEENLALAYLRAGQKTASFSRISKKDEEYFREKLSMLNMGLEDRMHTLVGTLSGGQRQALTLLMATIVTPKLLLLDEHTAALDPQAAEKITALTKRIVEENEITCLMITHHMKQALSIGNRTLFMSNGRIVMDLNEEERKQISVNELLERFKESSKEEFDNDRMMLSE
ncbi:MAG: ATP-binding cassette domain-containing protein [Solobacterium sp.]|nr:ATP-binding cassette domain-containing protein [Solobacterium sp.]